jgi:hypothetical protein
VILAQDGKSDEAARALVAAGKVADSLAAEPLMISQFARYSTWNLVCSQTERAVNLGKFNDRELKGLQTLLEAGERTNSLLLAFVGERAGSLSVFTEPRAQTAMLTGQWGTTTSGQRLQTQLAFGMMKATGLFTKDKNFFLDTMSNFVWAAEQPHPLRWTESQALPAPVAPNRFWILSRMLLPALNKATKKDVEHAARIRIAQAALAVERFRLAHANGLPENLQDLVPVFCAAVPLDPFDGAPVRYKRLVAGYVVYSIGADGKDDGGAEYNPKTSSGYDITFKLEK